MKILKKLIAQGKSDEELKELGYGAAEIKKARKAIAKQLDEGGGDDEGEEGEDEEEEEEEGEDEEEEEEEGEDEEEEEEEGGKKKVKKTKSTLSKSQIKEIAAVVSSVLESRKHNSPTRKKIYGKAKAFLEINGEKRSKKAVKQVGEFFKAMKNGDREAMKEIDKSVRAEFKALNEGTGTSGGYMVHPEFDREVMRIIEEYGVARKIFRVLPMGSDTKNISSITSKPIAYMAGEASTVTDSQPGIGQIILTAKKAMAFIISSNELIDDNSTDMEIWSLMAELLAEAFAKIEDEQCFSGSGTGNNHTGLLISTDSTITTVTMATGKTEFSDMDVDDALNLKKALSSVASRKRGQYLGHPDILDNLRGIKDSDGRYILQEPAGSDVVRLWNKPFVEADAMPSNDDTAVSTKFLAFGDYKKAGVMGDRKTLQLKQLTEGTVGSVNLGEEDQEALRGVRRFAFSVALGEAVALLKTAAS